MTEVPAAAPATGRAPRRRGLSRSVQFAAALAALSALISLGGRYAGHGIALAGYTDDRTSYEVVIGNDVLSVPANMIRQARARRDGAASRLDLYLRWPELDGFSEVARDDFNNQSGTRRLLFLTFEPRMMSRDMSGRLEPIYRALTVKPGKAGPSGITVYDFKPDSGYVDEMLVVAEQGGGETFVARCLSGKAAPAALAPCERDIAVTDRLSLTYRFPRERLDKWQALDAAMRRTAKALLRTAD